MPPAEPSQVGRGSAGDLKHRMRERETGERGKVVKIRRSDGVERYNNDTSLVEGSRGRLRGFLGVVEACVCGRLFAMVVVRVQGAMWLQTFIDIIFIVCLH